MSVAKAVVLARGLGTRMRQDDGSGAKIAAAQEDAANLGVKAMMPLGVGVDRAADGGGAGGGGDAGAAARPFLDYVLSALADAGYTDVCLVIGPDHDRVRHYYTVDAPPRRVRIAFAIQAEPRGTADALLAAEAFAADDDVLVINGDNYYPAADMRALRELGATTATASTSPTTPTTPATPTSRADHAGAADIAGIAGTVLYDPQCLAQRGNIAPERIRAFAVGAITPDGFLSDIVEKPDDETLRAMADATGGRALVSMNCWRLPPSIFEACRAVRPSARGELELTQAIRDAVRTRGLRVKVLTSREGVLDLSRRGDIATVTARLREVIVHP